MRPLTSVRGFALGVGAVEGETETETAAKVNGEADVVKFPQKGKNVEQAPPRMRFAPSPTGRCVNSTQFNSTYLTHVM